MVQKLDETKRREIMEVAARLFAERPFHEVKLEDVAAEAKVGKGTLYCYFSSKDDLYVSLIADGFARLIAGIRDGLAEVPEVSCWDRLQLVVDRLVWFSRQCSCLLRLMRSSAQINEPRLRDCRGELAQVIESVIRAGVEQGEFADPAPALTAQYILAFVRAANLYGPPDLPEDDLKNHIMLLLRHGLDAESGTDRNPS